MTRISIVLNEDGVLESISGIADGVEVCVKDYNVYSEHSYVEPEDRLADQRGEFSEDIYTEDVFKLG